MTPAIYLRPNGHGYNIDSGGHTTNLPDGYAQIVLFGKYGDSTSISLTGDELAELRDRISELID